MESLMNAHLLHARENGRTTQVSSIDPALALLKVEVLMNSLVVGPNPDLASAMAHHQIASGGKRVRARLAISACSAFGVPEDSAIAWAAAMELLHNATLVHDDIQDGDTMRRECSTVWARYGVAQAINAGDLLLMLPFLALAKIPSNVRGELSVLVADYATRIVRGQVAELNQKLDGTAPLSAYIKACEGKTGALLALPVVGAAIMDGRSARDAERLAAPFIQLGVLFQLQDDLVDMFGDKGRGTIGGDIFEGKNSALLGTLAHCAPEAANEVFRIVQKSREETTEADVYRVRDLYQFYRIPGQVLDRILRIRDRVLHSTILIQEPELHALAEMLSNMAMAPLSHLLGDDAL
jgi:geranylgeranyl pyrophosphate synthase